MEYVKSNLCQNEYIGLSCFGCCGRDFKTKDELIEDLKRNTLQFKIIKDIEEFIKRGRDLTPSGLCKHLIIKGDNIVCPLHPEENQGKEFRSQECNILYECKTSFEFKSWDKKKQAEFLNFIKNKNLDSVEFSIKIDDGSLLLEFNELQA